MCRCIDPGLSCSQRDAIELRWTAVVCIAGVYGVEDGTANLTTPERPRSVRGSILDVGIANQARNASVQSSQLSSNCWATRIASSIDRIKRPTRLESRATRFQARLDRSYMPAFQQLFNRQQEACRPLPCTR